MDTYEKLQSEGYETMFSFLDDDGPTYSNFVEIRSIPHEFHFLFKVLPASQITRPIPKETIVMSPMIAKMLHRELGKHIEGHEAEYGAIHLPDDYSLVKGLFGIGDTDDSEV